MAANIRQYKLGKWATFVVGWAVFLIIAITFFPELLLALSTSLASEPLQKPARDFNKTVRVLDDTSGGIAEIAINVPREECDQVIPVVDGLLKSLNAETKLLFSCSDDYCVRAIQNRLTLPREYFPWKTDIVLTKLGLTPWARDRRIARSGLYGVESFSLVPPGKDWYDIGRRNEIKLPYLLNELKLAPEAIPLPFILDGGNLVTDSHYAFIGGNNISLNRNIIPNQEDLKRMIRLYLGTPVVHIFARKKQVPWDHIDMYVTPLPGKRVLVASPDLAKSLLAERDERNPIVHEKFLKLSFSQERSRLFDDVAVQFKKLKYTVHRVPAIPHYLDHWMITYNNVLMDFREHSQFVYVPSYGIQSLDNYARKLYQGLGFEVRPIDVTTLYRNGGSLRCFANVTRRIPDLAYTVSV